MHVDRGFQGYRILDSNNLITDHKADVCERAGSVIMVPSSGEFTMNESEEKNSESTEHHRSRLACGVGLFLCLVFHVLSYPFGYAAARRFPSPVDEAVRAGVKTLYIPIDLALTYNQAVYNFYDWYLAQMYQTFPGYFEMPILLPIPVEHASLRGIDPPL